MFLSEDLNGRSGRYKILNGFSEIKGSEFLFRSYPTNPGSPFWSSHLLEVSRLGKSNRDGQLVSLSGQIRGKAMSCEPLCPSSK